MIWGGALLGCFIPLFAWALVKACRLRVVYLFQFFTGFCLIADGCFVGVGTFFDMGDAGDLAFSVPWLVDAPLRTCLRADRFVPLERTRTALRSRRSSGQDGLQSRFGYTGAVLIVVVVEGTAAVLLTGSPKP